MTRSVKSSPAWCAALALGVTVLGASGATMLAGPAYAQSDAKATVDAAKTAGTVGEKADGYLGVVSGGDAATRGAVAEINAGRAAAYRDAAARTGVSPDAAGQAAFRMLLGRMPPGQFYKPAGGDWTRK